MLKAVLFDLDDTLLGNDVDIFLPNYYAILGQFAESYLPSDLFLRELKLGVEAMILNVDSTLSLRDVLWHHLAQSTGVDAQTLEKHLDEFYRGPFHQLRAYTEKRPFALQLVHYCLEHNLDVVVATNPLFPRIAIEARLAWAGLPVEQYDFTLVTSYENMHAAKPNPAYYAEILDKLDCLPAQALMVGNDWQNDIVPAHGLGLQTCWLAVNGEPLPDDLPVLYGRSLQDIHKLLVTQLEPEAA